MLSSQIEQFQQNLELMAGLYNISMNAKMKKYKQFSKTALLRLSEYLIILTMLKVIQP